MNSRKNGKINFSNTFLSHAWYCHYAVHVNVLKDDVEEEEEEFITMETRGRKGNGKSTV